MSLEHIFGPPLPDGSGHDHAPSKDEPATDEVIDHDATGRSLPAITSTAAVSGALVVTTLAHVAASLPSTEVAWWHWTLAALFAVTSILAAVTGTTLLAVGALLVAAWTSTPPIAAWIGAPLLAFATARMVWTHRQGLR